jgi:hypothetical protein
MQNRTSAQSRHTQAPDRRDQASAHRSFRAAIYGLAAVLGAYCIWLCAADIIRPGVQRLPTERQDAAVAAQQRSAAISAARVGIVRGDLWAEAAFTFSDSLWPPSTGNASPATTIDQAHETLVQTVRYAPSRADVWLLLAALATRYRWPAPEAAEALRMSYFTGPGELSLMPLRARVAAQLATPDLELDQFAQRDLRLLLAQRQKSAVTQIYQSASPAHKRAIEKTVGEIEPALVDALRHSADAPHRGNE